MEPNKYPKARTGIQQGGGGFGFNGPSEAWLRANGQLPNQYIGTNSELAQVETLTTEEKEERRLKALERFSHPQEEVKFIPMPEAKKNLQKKMTPAEKAEKEEIAKRREAALQRTQVELDNTVLPQVPIVQTRHFDPEKRQKCLSGINLKPRRAEIIIPQIQIQINLEHLINGPDADFTLISQDGLEIKVHRVILSARSVIFNTILTSQSAESVSGIYHLHDFSGKVLNYLVRYLYSGIAKVTSLDVIELLYLADFFKIDSLKILIEKELENCVDLENVITLWELSEDMRMEELKRECWKYCKKNPDVKMIVKDMSADMREQYYKMKKKG